MSDALGDPRIERGMQAQLRLRRQQLQEGARQIGWKVGFGAPAAKEKLRLRAPLVGYLLDRALLESGATVSIAAWQRPVAEAEIAVHIGQDVPAHANRETVRRAISAVGPAIELADVQCAMDDVEAILSCDIFQRHVIVGPRDIMRSGGRLDGLRGRLTRSGKDVPVPVDLESNTGRIHDIIAHVADTAAAVGDGLRAGQVVICGSLTAPMFLELADTGIDFALEPIGRISVRFGA
jgi:2-keto-4-pentenoate hydratase